MSTACPRVIASLSAFALTAGAAAFAADVGSASSPVDLRIALDLSPPAIAEIYSPEQIAELLNRPLRDMEEVRVESARLEAESESDAPVIPEGLEAVIWSVPNPAQAWHIFMPITADQVNPFSAALDSVVYSQPTALPTRDPAMFP